MRSLGLFESVLVDALLGDPYFEDLRVGCVASAAVFEGLSVCGDSLCTKVGRRNAKFFCVFLERTVPRLCLLSECPTGAFWV